MATKYMRGVDFNTQFSANYDGAFLMKFIYEFWCYIINGGSNPTVPGGLAPTTPSTMQANFVGGTSLLTSGTDGVTTLDSNIFTAASAPFTSSMIGKHLVVWSPGSGSSEDAIYPIINFNSTSSIVIDVNKGGTPAPGTLRPHLTGRTGLCYRVFDDYVAATAVTDVTARYFVIQMTPPVVNVGQANSQVQFNMLGAPNYVGKPMDISMYLSPAGTWTGSAFTDASSEIRTDTASNYSNYGLFSVGSAVGNDRYNNVVLIGDKDFLLMYVYGESSGSFIPSCFHLEIPERIHAADVNPITLMLSYCINPWQSGDSVYEYGGGFRAKWDDNVTRKHRTVTRARQGDNNPFGSAGTTEAAYLFNSPLNKMLLAPVYIGQHGYAGHYSFLRAKIRKLSVTLPALPNAMRLGDYGEWYHCRNGICWPWDNTVMPYPLFLRGVS